MPGSPPLDGRRVIVSGSTRGLGLAFAVALCQAGAAVVVNGHDAGRCEEVVAALRSAGGTAVAAAGSVADTDDVARVVATAETAFGGVDVVVNNAGLTRDRSLLRMSVQEFDEVVAVHLRGTWDLTRQAARLMRDRPGPAGGSIVNVVSGSALYGLVGQSNYAAAKGGVLALTRALSRELAPYDVVVNALYPVAATDMTAPVLQMAGDGSLPVFEAPERVAPAVVALASADPAVRAVTGQVVCFDGRALTLWTHPEQGPSSHRDGPWSAADVGQALVALPPEPLHPDALGTAVIEALAASARQNPRRPA